MLIALNAILKQKRMVRTTKNSKELLLVHVQTVIKIYIRENLEITAKPAMKPLLSRK
jgi:hypothetical protein